MFETTKLARCVRPLRLEVGYRPRQAGPQSSPGRLVQDHPCQICRPLHPSHSGIV